MLATVDLFEMNDVRISLEIVLEYLWKFTPC